MITNPCAYQWPISTKPASDHHSISSTIELESPTQFEFVDPQSGRPVAANKPPEPPGSSGNIETLSENLIVAPQGGGSLQSANVTQQQLQPTLDLPSSSYGSQMNPPYSGRTPSSATTNTALREQSADLLNPRNSIGGFGGQDPMMQQQSNNFFDRLSSIELLFLISSVMFLVLLALGLAASYHCFRRQSKRRANQRASAILRNKQRYLATGGGFQPPVVIPAAATLAQHYQRQTRPQSYHPGGPSSPESDLSGRNLLGAPPHHQAYMFNRAFVPDGSHHYISSPTAAGGGEDSKHYIQHGGVMRQVAESRQHGRPSTQPAVLGRRDTVYGNSHYGYLSNGRHPHYLAPMNGKQPTISKRPISYSISEFPPLLAGGKVSNQYHHHHHHPRHESLLTTSLDHRRANSNNYLQQEEPLPKYTLANHHSPRHHKQHRSSHRAQPVLVTDSSLPHLWRAKSLSSVDQATSTNQPSHLREDYTASIKQPIGGTLSRHENGNYRRRQREIYSHGEVNEPVNVSPNEDLSDDQEPNNNTANFQKPSSYKPKILLKSIEDSYVTNYTEIHEQEYIKQEAKRNMTMAEWRALQPERKQRRRRRANGDDSKGSRQTSDDNTDDTDDDQGAGLHEGEQPYQSTQTNLRSLTELDVNFAKSLLIPVNRARQISSQTSHDIRPSNTTASLPKRSTDDTDTASSSSSPNDLNRAKSRQSGDGSVERQPSSSSVQETGQVRNTTFELQVAGGGGGVTNTSRPPQPGDKQPIPISKGGDGRQNSPDLILSPDYDYDRLELEPEGSRASHNSVSYV